MIARLFCLLTLLAAQAFAQETVLTPEQAVRLAVQRPDIAALLEAEIDLAQSELIAARTWPNPSLTLERTSPGERGNEGDETTFMLSQQFELSGRRRLQRRAAQLGVEAAEAAASAQRQQISLQVLRRYYEVLVLTQRVEAYRGLSNDFVELSRVAARRSLAGDLSGYEGRRIEQRRQMAGAQLENMEIRLLSSREGLASLIGVAAENLGIDQRSDLLPDTNRYDSELDAVALVNPQLGALDGRRVASAAALQAASRPAFPVTVGLGQRRLEGLTGSDNALLLEVSLPLPLFDRNQAARSRAQAESRQADSRYRLTLQEMQSRLNSTRIEAMRLADAAQRLRADVVPEARQLTAIARSSFAEGELDLTGLLAAFDAEIEVVNQSLDLQYRARTAWIELEQMTQPDPLTTGNMP